MRKTFSISNPKQVAYIEKSAFIKGGEGYFLCIALPNGDTLCSHHTTLGEAKGNASVLIPMFYPGSEVTRHE